MFAFALAIHGMEHRLDGDGWRLCPTVRGTGPSCVPAKVPGGVWDNLVRAGSVGDPLYRDNSMRDYNAAHRSSTQQVKQRDMDRIKTDLGEECTRFFTEALSEDPAYDLVTEWQEGEEVLLVFPNIVNLDVTSPDLNSPSMSRSYSASAGAMTLYLELIDAETSEVLMRAYDSKADPDSFVNYANRITNRQAADRMLKDWATRLRAAMDQTLRASADGA